MKTIRDIIHNEEEPAYKLFEQALETVFDKDDPRTEYLNRLSPVSRLAYLIWCFDGEIHNGGFDQLFINSLGNHTQEILEGLKLIGAQKSEALLKKAMAYFPNANPPQDRAKRLDIWLKISEADSVQNTLDELDQEFYKYEDNIAKLLDDYLLANQDKPFRA
jgi:hypothetical protein